MPDAIRAKQLAERDKRIISELGKTLSDHILWEDAVVFACIKVVKIVEVECSNASATIHLPIPGSPRSSDSTRNHSRSRESSARRVSAHKKALE